jgi:hypothetical protein
VPNPAFGNARTIVRLNDLIMPAKIFKSPSFYF